VDEHHGEECELMVETSATTTHEHYPLCPSRNRITKCEFGIAFVFVDWVTDDLRAECIKGGQCRG
jgi:hypothetical protein